MRNKRVLGIIPAREGSKGIPRKNIRFLCQKPLLAYTVMAACKSRSLERVILSTDNSEIADIGKQYGAEAPFLRPAEFATDQASSISVLHHALKWLKQEEGYQPEAVALLSPTCPLRTPDQIDGAVDLLWTSDLDSSSTVCPVKDHPFFVFARKGNSQLVEFISIPDKPLRRQDLPEYYVSSQAVLVSRSTYLVSVDDASPVINLDSVSGYEMDRISGFDIDTPHDFIIAESLMRERMQRNMNDSIPADII